MYHIYSEWISTLEYNQWSVWNGKSGQTAKSDVTEQFIFKWVWHITLCDIYIYIYMSFGG